MLHTFLKQNRAELIDRCKAKVLLRPARGKPAPVQQHGIPRFLDQLIETLRVEQTSAPAEASERISGVAGGANSASTVMGTTASLHGREMLAEGYSVHDVVHDYGDLCQAVTELAGERAHDIEVVEFHTLNRCLDNAIADAVKAHAEGHAGVVEDEVDVANARHGRLLSDLRGQLRTANLAFSILKSGQVAAGGATGKLLEGALARLGMLVEQRAAEEDLPEGVRSGAPPSPTPP